MPPRNTGSRRGSRDRTPAEVESPQYLTTPGEQRRAQINMAAKDERAAAKEYSDAIDAASKCDPLTDGYGECQRRLLQASLALLTARDVLARTTKGVDVSNPTA